MLKHKCIFNICLTSLCSRLGQVSKCFSVSLRKPLTVAGVGLIGQKPFLTLNQQCHSFKTLVSKARIHFVS